VSLALRDPVLIDFVAPQDARRERDLEAALVADVTRFMHALGDGFLYAGRQRAIAIGDDREYRLDLLFCHHPTARWVVIDLKLGPFKPEHAGKMNAYVNAVDAFVAREGDRPTVGFILCAGRSEAEARLTLRGLATPLAVGRYRIGAEGVVPTEEPADATSGVGEELAALADVERQVARFAARRRMELSASADRPSPGTTSGADVIRESASRSSP